MSSMGKYISGSTKKSETWYILTADNITFSIVNAKNLLKTVILVIGVLSISAPPPGLVVVGLPGVVVVTGFLGGVVGTG